MRLLNVSDRSVTMNRSATMNTNFSRGFTFLPNVLYHCQSSPTGIEEIDRPSECLFARLRTSVLWCGGNCAPVPVVKQSTYHRHLGDTSEIGRKVKEPGFPFPISSIIAAIVPLNGLLIFSRRKTRLWSFVISVDV